MRVFSLAITCLACLPSITEGQTPSFTATAYTSFPGARSAVSADVNGDGWSDLATANAGRNSVTVLLNRGASGGFLPAQEIRVGTGPFDLDAGDFDRDGVIDLVVTTPDANAIELLRLGPTGALRSRLVLAGAGHSRGARLADITGDGWLDLVYSDFNRGVVVVVPNDGRGGVFSDLGAFPVGAAPQGVAVHDFNRDGKLDVAVTSTSTTSLTILEGTTSGFTRRTYSAGWTLNALAPVDVNRDGWLDLAAVSTTSNRLVLLRGSASGFAAAAVVTTGNSPRTLTTADVNDDGRNDVLVANRASSSVSVFLGRTNDSFALTAFGQLPAGSGARAIAAADFDNNGLVDVAVGHDLAASITLFDNDTALVPAAFSLRRELVGDGSQGLGGGDLVVADFNEDGRPDMVNGPRVLIDGKTAVPFALRAGTSVHSAGVADLNRDGHLDVALAVSLWDPARGASWDGVEIHTGNGRGAFALQNRIQTGGSLRELELGDVNRDGVTDVVVVDFYKRLVVVQMDAGGGYDLLSTPLPDFASALEVEDINRDGILDAITANAYPGAIMVSRGTGSGFGAAIRYEIPNEATDIETGDLDHDGRVDLVVIGFGRVGVMRGNGNGTFGAPDWFGDQTWAPHTLIADFTQDGHLDAFLSNGGLLPGRGDGTFGAEQRFAAEVFGTTAADWNRDGLPDVVTHDQVLLNERRAVNRAPVAVGQDRAMTYLQQFGEEEPFISGFGSEDPDLHALTYEWRDEKGQVMVVTDYPFAFFTPRRPPGTYRFTLVVKDGRGAEGSDELVVTIAPSKELVLWPGFTWSDEGWINVEDETAASGIRVHYPDAGAPKVNAPAANPTHYRDIWFTPDPTQTYKLWVRLKADRNSFANDSIWLQFSGAADTSGNPVGRIGTTQGLAVNLEECSGCGVSGWGWEDDAWGGRNLNGMLLRFPDATQPQFIRIQVREDGVSVDQIVLSAEKYLTTRPGTAKDDTTILPTTQPD